MNKILNKLCLVLLLFLSIIVLSGCDKTEKKTIDTNVIGTWEYSEEDIDATYVFEKNGTGSYTIAVGENSVVKEVEYYTKDNKFYINFDNDPDTFELEYKMVDDGIIIYDSQGTELLYKKK